MKNYKNLSPSNEEIEALLESSKSRVDSAKILMEKRKYGDAISRSYYAFLDSARAALLTRGKFTKTHTGTLNLFEAEFRKTNLIPIEFIKFYREVLKNRMEADYQFLKKFSAEEVERAIKMAEEFVSFVEKNLIKK